jgi:glycosyltransferase involved in cell wall biosynthesis
MSVYKEPKEFLTKAIESILNQTYKNFEFLITIDNPGYKHNNILNKYSKDDQRIKLIYNKTNIGLTKSLNNAIEIVKGKYVARQDADDISLPQRLELQYDFLENNPIYSIVGTNIRFVDDNGKFIKRIRWPVTHKDISRTMYKRNKLVHGTVLMKKEDLISVGKYNGNLKYGQDYELWLRFLRNNKKIYILYDSLYYLRKHQKSVTVKSAFHQSMMHFLIQKEIDFDKFNSKSIEVYLSMLKEKEKSYVYYMTSKIILRSNVAESLEYCKDSIKYNKYNINTYILFCYIMLKVFFRKEMKHA